MDEYLGNLPKCSVEKQAEIIEYQSLIRGQEEAEKIAKRSYCTDESHAAYVGGEPNTRTEASFYILYVADPSIWYQAA